LRLARTSTSTVHLSANLNSARGAPQDAEATVAAFIAVSNDWGTLAAEVNADKPFAVASCSDLAQFCDQ
jgi:hypothetical protein